MGDCFPVYDAAVFERCVFFAFKSWIHDVCNMPDRGTRPVVYIIYNI
jgi:hypothetical protein